MHGWVSTTKALGGEGEIVAQHLSEWRPCASLPGGPAVASPPVEQVLQQFCGLGLLLVHPCDQQVVVIADMAQVLQLLQQLPQVKQELGSVCEPEG